MARWQFTLADLEYAASQLEDTSTVVFGSRPWEKYIELNEADLWMAMVADCAGGTHNREMRQLLTMVYAPIYLMTDETLPPLPKEALDALTLRYPDSGDSFVKAADKLGELMTAIHPMWSRAVTDRIEESSLSLEQLHSVALYSLLVIESFLNLHHTQAFQALRDALSPEPAPTPKPVPVAPKDPHKMAALVPVTDNQVTLADIGGYEDIKEKIRDLATVINQPGVMERWAVDVPRGVLLYGPPGVGKTYWAYALASEVQRPFFDVKRGQVTSAFVNESAKWIEEMFAQVKKAGGGVLFLDEVDGLLFSRNNTHISPEDHKVITALNKNLQRPEKSDGILVVMATNRKDLVDSAAIRAERVDLVIEFRNPNDEDRLGVLKARFRKAERKSGRTLFKQKMSSRLVADTEGFSCADLSEVVRRVLWQRAKRELAGESDSLIGSDDFLSVIAAYRVERINGAKPSIGF